MVSKNPAQPDQIGCLERSVTEKKTHNFTAALPEALAAQAAEMLKSRYNLEFLGIEQAVKERELETQLVDNLQRFLLELGYGFCFIGRQYRLVLGTKEYFVDLLFYHRFLKALVAFDLKIGEFEPEHAGQMDFYLNVLNEQQRGPEDGPSIGIILCAEKSDIEVECALKSKSNPIGVAQYELQTKLARWAVARSFVVNRVWVDDQIGFGCKKRAVPHANVEKLLRPFRLYRNDPGWKITESHLSRVDSLF